MAENKCISKICLIGFDENIVEVVEDKDGEENKGEKKTKE